MEIGIIGTGDMGKLYARAFARAGYRVNACDLPGKREELERELDGSGVHLLDGGIAVSRRSDLIIYSVETENIASAVKMYGPSTKKDAIVGGQTSVKSLEVEAFERYLPPDINIVTCHSLHGPTVDPHGQSLVVIKHRSTDDAYKRALEAFEKLGSNISEISSCQEHDRITADVQSVTHVGFESLGTAWKNAGFFPWENATYAGGIDNVKVLLALRIYAGKSHVYAGLAIFNPLARELVKQYARSESELFKLMIQEEQRTFRERLLQAGDFVFGNVDTPIPLDDTVMGEFSLGSHARERLPNSHLSLLAMVDTWYQLKINPYDNLVYQTPPFRLRLGIAEYLFRNTSLLEESIQAALLDKGIRGDDLEFHTVVREWASVIGHGDLAGYKEKFEDTKHFFQGRLTEAKQKSDNLIRRITGV